MDLQKTIAEFEQKAADYKEAANSLRALLAHEAGSAPSPARVATVAAGTATTSAPRRGRKPGQKAARPAGKRGAVSAETKAKIAAAMRAKHQARREAAGKA